MGCVGLRHGPAPDPCVAVLFGASGDLARRELVPALYELAGDDLLPERYAILGVARHDWSDAEFRRRMRAATGRGREARRRWEGFARRLHYVAGDLESAATYATIRDRLAALHTHGGPPPNVLFHLATPPSLFGTIARQLEAAGLARAEHGWRRLVVEKPFGADRASAARLDRALRAVFPEEAIYRIDHFLGKETVQNLLVVRFANPSFEPIWNRHHVDHVQITVAEDIGIGTRGAFYDATGVVRDMVQNHLLQLLCLVAMEPPVRLDGPALRDETVKVLDALAVAPLRARDCVLGQYGAGRVGGTRTVGYREEDDVSARSITPTYAACRFTIDSWRWAGVPFYLRTGKRLARKLSEIAVHFRPSPLATFAPAGAAPPNTLVFRLQPEEGILQTFAAKQPGPELCVQPVTSRFLYADAFGLARLPRAYAWLLRDVMQGDQTLFARADWIARAWAIVAPALAIERRRSPRALRRYAAGSAGPAEADALLARDGRAWRPLDGVA